MPSETLSVVIITKNEETRIKNCLESVKWANEIVIVDDNSTDKTIEIAQNYTDRIFRKKMDIEGKHRNWVYAQARNSWILSLDADERVTSELKEEITKLLRNSTEFEGYTIPRRNYIGSYWVRFGGWYPSAQLKLFKKGSLRYEEAEVHPRPIFDKPWADLKSDIIHYSYRDFSDFLNKTNKQTTLEAIKWYKLSLKDPKKARYKMNLVHALWRTFDRFIRCFFIKKGYRDGFVGFMVAYFSSLYQIVSYAKYRELIRNKRDEDKNAR